MPRMYAAASQGVSLPKKLDSSNVVSRGRANSGPFSLSVGAVALAMIEQIAPTRSQMAVLPLPLVTYRGTP